jgi:hypothetical protein
LIGLLAKRLINVEGVLNIDRLKGINDAEAVIRENSVLI